MPILRFAGCTYSPSAAQDAARILAALIESVEVIHDDEAGQMLMQCRGSAELFGAVCSWGAAEENDEPDVDDEADARDEPIARETPIEVAVEGRLPIAPGAAEGLAEPAIALRAPPAGCELALQRAGSICPASRHGVCSRPCSASASTLIGALKAVPFDADDPFAGIPGAFSTPGEFLTLAAAPAAPALSAEAIEAADMAEVAASFRDEEPLPFYSATDFRNQAAPVLTAAARRRAVEAGPRRHLRSVKLARRALGAAALLALALFEPGALLRQGSLDLDHDGRLGLGDLAVLFSIDDVRAAGARYAGEPAPVDGGHWLAGSRVRRLVTVGPDTIAAEFERAERGRLILREYRVAGTGSVALLGGQERRCYENRGRFA